MLSTSRTARFLCCVLTNTVALLGYFELGMLHSIKKYSLFIVFAVK